MSPPPKKVVHSICLFSLLMGLASIQAQALVNREWVQAYGLPDSIAWSASATDGQGHLYTVGNTIHPSQGADVLLTKHDAEGQLLWERTFDHQGSHDYGIALLLHSDGSLIVAAALYDTLSDYDIGLLAYDAQGTLAWSLVYDYEEKYDLPTALSEAPDGSLYLAAATTGDSTEKATVWGSKSTSGYHALQPICRLDFPYIY